MLDFNEEEQNKKLEELRKQEAEELARVLSDKYGIQYIDLSVKSINSDALKVIPEEEARAGGVAAFQIAGKKLSVAILSPNSQKTKDVLAELENKGFVNTVYMVTQSSLDRAWDRYKELSKSFVTKAGLIDISTEILEEFMQKTKTIEDIRASISEITANKNRNTSQIFEMILAGALALGASDIHMEPQELTIRLRYRLDGVLHDIDNFDKGVYRLIASRIKLLSSLKLNFNKNAQDGRFTINVGLKDIEVRTSVGPGAYGETIVMRLLDPEAISINLEDMSIEPKLLGIFLNEIEKPNGLILVTGPTGSGKTTTLYAFLKKVNQPSAKIITIEDPIEYHLKGLSQTQVNEDAGYTFLEGLRSVMRQDPDIIMVGEIRDSETAKIAINAALTGHLVFSTLHTNDAAGAIPRLVDLGVNHKIIASALTLTIAQRLTRQLCQVCKKEIAPDARQKKIIDTLIGDIKEKRPDIRITNTEKIWTIGGIPCKACNGIGYKGRIAVFEAILVDKDIEKVIDEKINDREIKEAAKKQGILDMREDGILKVLNGVTSMEELERVVELERREEYT